MRRTLHRCKETGRRAGASARNSATRSRPSCFMTARSCVGLAMPRAAANASAISSGVKNRSARWYTRSASVRTARTSIMLARSTACRHGEGRTWAKATSMRQHVAVLDQQVGRLDVAVSEPGVPELADQPEPLVDHAVVDLGIADLLGTVEELGDEQVLALGGELDDARRVRPSGCPSRGGDATCSPRTAPAAGRTGTAPRPRGGRRGWSVRPCTSGRRGRGSSRRASRTGTCRARPRPAVAAVSSHPSLRGRPA